MQARKLSKTQRPLFAAAAFAFVFFCGAPFASAAAISAPSNNLGLVGYWSFNEGAGTIAHDLSGRGNNGTLTNGPAWTGGKYSNAVFLDGTDDSINMGDPVSGALDFGTDSFTVSVWVKGVSGPSPDTASYYLVSKKLNGIGWVVSYGNCAGSNRICFNVEDGSGNIARTNFQLSNLSSGTWNLLTAVTDRSAGQVYLYLNGVSIGASGNASLAGVDTVDNNLPFLLGVRSSTYLSGSVDDLRVYRRALSATEISNLYSSGAGRLAVPGNKGLIGYWNLDEGTGTIAHDASGNGKTGTFTVSPAWTTGRTGGALDFNGTDQYLDTTLQIGGGDVTASVWFKARSQITGAGTVRPLLGQGLGGNLFYLAMLIPSSGSGLNCTWNGSDTATVAPGPYNDGKWHLATCVRSDSVVNLYVDGVLAGSGTSTGGAPNTSTGVQIGGSSSNASRKFNGSLDDVRIYSRALSATEIAALYGAGAARLNASSVALTVGSTLANGLVGLWTFDGPDVTDKVYDRSGNANNGYFIGGATSTAKTIGKLGQGLSFSGSTYVDLGSTGLIQGATNNNNFSISAWINLAAYDAPQRPIYGEYTSENVYTKNYLFVDGATKKLSFDQYSPNGGSIATNGLISLNTWYHIVYAQQGANRRLYVNGILDTSDAGAETYTGTVPNQVLIGHRGGSGSNYQFVGKIDDVRLYNRTLSAAEVKQLYSLGK